ncbi:MAG: hypothetical protein ACRCR1_13470 [Aeromonas sp.]
MIYASPATCAATFFVILALCFGYVLRHMALESDCFDEGIARSIAFACAALVWSALVALLSVFLVEMFAGFWHMLFN